MSDLLLFVKMKMTGSGGMIYVASFMKTVIDAEGSLSLSNLKGCEVGVNDGRKL
jgi:hypothetical protein